MFFKKNNKFKIINERNFDNTNFSELWPSIEEMERITVLQLRLQQQKALFFSERAQLQK